jgi:hypothetical protein
MEEDDQDTMQYDGPLDISEVEKKHLVTIRNKENEEVVVPFGYINKQWEYLKSLYQEGDELYCYWTKAGSWKNRCGRVGFVLRRNGKEIASIATLMN